MELSEIIQQPDGFTPPQVTVKIEKVWDYKSGTSKDGPWSFQDVQVEGGRLKLKNLPEFPKSREGQSVTLKAAQSKQHGLTGLKVAHETYKDKTYDKLVVTGSANWVWADGSHASSNGAGTSSTPSPALSVQSYLDHINAVAELAREIASTLQLEADEAVQACFATLCIDTKNRGLLLPKPQPDKAVEEDDHPEGEVDPDAWDEKNPKF